MPRLSVFKVVSGDACLRPGRRSLQRRDSRSDGGTKRILPEYSRSSRPARGGVTWIRVRLLCMLAMCSDLVVNIKRPMNCSPFRSSLSQAARGENASHQWFSMISIGFQ